MGESIFSGRLLANIMGDLANCRTVELSRCRIVELSNCRIVETLNCEVVEVPRILDLWYNVRSTKYNDANPFVHRSFLITYSLRLMPIIYHFS